MLVSHEISQNWLLMHTACHLRHLWFREKLKSNHLTTIGGVVEISKILEKTSLGLAFKPKIRAKLSGMVANWIFD